MAFADIRDALTGKSYVEEYVATLTHEIKSPLAAIRGAAELLREPLPENARVRFTDNIEEQVARAQDMVDRMLELSSLERRAIVAQHERLSVAALADAVRAELAPVAAQRGVELFIDVDPELEISGDRFLLQRALSNLVSNAIDFAPAETAVTVDAQQVRDRIEITVRDHGAGLPPYASERAFEKFFSTPRPNGKKGTGLGTRVRARDRAAARRSRTAGQSRRRRRTRDDFAATTHGQLKKSSEQKGETTKGSEHQNR